MNFLSLVRTIYSSTRQVASALVERNNRYESVVLAEYREGYSVFGFLTGDVPEAVQATMEEPAYAVFVPNSPNPTGGRLLLVPESQVQGVDMSVRRGIRTSVTTGIAAEEREALAREDESRDSDSDPSADRFLSVVFARPASSRDASTGRSDVLNSVRRSTPDRLAGDGHRRAPACAPVDGRSRAGMWPLEAGG